MFLNNFSECIERVKKDVPFVPHVPKATKVLIVQTEVKGGLKLRETEEHDDQGVTCPKCGAYLGPRQPLPNTLVKCLKCKVWVNNDGQEARA